MIKDVKTHLSSNLGLYFINSPYTQIFQRSKKIYDNSGIIINIKT